MDYGKLSEDRIKEVKEIEKAVDTIIRVYGIWVPNDGYICKFPYRDGVLIIKRSVKDLMRRVGYVDGSTFIGGACLFFEDSHGGNTGTGVLSAILFGPWVDELKELRDGALKYLEEAACRTREQVSLVLRQTISETDI